MILCLIAPILSRPDQPGYGSPAPSYPDEPAKYAYQYGVKDDYTSNNFGQAENRDGYSARGEYFVHDTISRILSLIDGVSYSVELVRDAIVISLKPLVF